MDVLETGLFEHVPFPMNSNGTSLKQQKHWFIWFLLVEAAEVSIAPWKVANISSGVCLRSGGLLKQVNPVSLLFPPPHCSCQKRVAGDFV